MIVTNVDIGYGKEYDMSRNANHGRNRAKIEAGLFGGADSPLAGTEPGSNRAGHFHSADVQLCAKPP